MKHLYETRKISWARAIPALVAVALILFAPNARAQGEGGNSSSGISVTGSGVAYGEPDQATLTVGVTAVAESVREAMAQADSGMENVREVALSHGLTSRDIRTASFNVWREELRDENNKVTGERYHVSHSYQLTVRNAALVGELLAATIDAGANDVGGINFSIADTDELRREARSNAMADARQRAEQLAQLAALELGAPTAIVETSSGAAATPQPMYSMRSDAAASPVEGGELAVRVEVSVTYSIKPGPRSE